MYMYKLFVKINKKIRYILSQKIQKLKIYKFNTYIYNTLYKKNTEIKNRI